MCGISGFIGTSSNKSLSFELLSNLFNNLQTRGIDASGYYACSNNNEVYHHKQKGKSSEIINSKEWKDLKDLNLNLFLLHTRRTSSNSGSSDNNINNHPFVNQDKTIALIHNGIINSNDFKKLKSFLNVSSDCDSEILLSFLLENKFENEDYFYKRLERVNELLFFIKNSEYAFAFSDLLKDKISLWLVKNDKRPLYIIDLKESLNQYFFVSTIEIWQNSISNIKNINKLLGNYNIINIPEFSIVNLTYENSFFNKIGFRFNNYEFKEKEFFY